MDCVRLVSRLVQASDDKNFFSTCLHDSTALLVLAVIWLKVLVDGLATDPEFAGEHGFRLACGGAANECGRLYGV